MNQILRYRFCRSPCLPSWIPEDILNLRPTHVHMLCFICKMSFKTFEIAFMRYQVTGEGKWCSESGVSAPVRLLSCNLSSGPVRNKWFDGCTSEGWIILSCCCRTFSSLWQYTVCHLVWIRSSPRQYDEWSISWCMNIMIHLQFCVYHHVSVIFIDWFD